MSDKIFNVRQRIKTDTQGQWALDQFIPLNGELLYYSDLKKLKVGDEVNYPSNLPFLYDGATVHYVENSGTSNGVWVANEPSIISYYDGLMVLIYTGNYSGGSSNTTLNINNLGAKYVVWATNTVNATSTFMPANTYQLLVYRSNLDKFQSVYNYGYSVVYRVESGNNERSVLFSSTSNPSSGSAYVINYNSNITINPSTQTITAQNFNGLAKKSSGITYLTTAPSEDNSDGDIKFVVLSTDPATKYSGYLYIITST